MELGCIFNYFISIPYGTVNLLEAKVHIRRDLLENKKEMESVDSKGTGAVADSDKTVDYEDVKCPGGLDCKHEPLCPIYMYNKDKKKYVFSENEKCDPGNNSIYGKEERDDEPQQALESVVKDIKTCTKELEAITLLENRSYNGFRYFENTRHNKVDLTERKNELYRIILILTEELKGRI